MNTIDKIEALEELLVGVELDAQYDPKAEAKTAALEDAIEYFWQAAESVTPFGYVVEGRILTSEEATDWAKKVGVAVYTTPPAPPVDAAALPSGMLERARQCIVMLRQHLALFAQDDIALAMFAEADATAALLAALESKDGN